VAAMVEQLGRVVDDTVSRMASADGRVPACRAGCDHCCYRTLLCSVPEVIRVAEFVKSTFTPEQKEALRQRLYDYERAVAPQVGFDLQRLRAPCPLLVNGRCSAYEARPFFCRGINSLDASACKEYRDHPDRRPRIPMIDGRLQAAQAVTMGLDHALRQAQMRAVPHDFGRALRIALEDPSAVQEWLEGGKSFVAAEGRGSLHREPPKAPTENPPAFDPNRIIYADYLSEQGDHRAALASLKGTHPAYALARARLPLAYSSEADVLEWRAYLERTIREFADSGFDPKEAFEVMGAFRANDISYHQVNNRELLAEIGELMCNRISARAYPELCEPIEGHRPPGRIRLGYAGYDIRDSSLTPWALGWLKHHTDDFETFVFNLGDLEDEATLEYRRHSAHYFHLRRDRSVDEHARFVKGLGLDVMIYLDAGSRSRSNQFASLRLARFQCSCWGGPETTGLPSIDYYLSSEMMEPENGQDHYTEKLVRLPRAGVCYLREPVRASTLEKRDLGLDEGRLIVSLQPPCKYDPQWDELYLRINEATGRPIVLVDRPRTGTSVLQERFARVGVRARFVPYLGPADYRALLEMADVVLDTPGWNGGITTVQALDAGTPVVTVPTGLRRGRQSLCFLELAGAPGLVARDVYDFVEFVANEDRVSGAIQGLDSAAMYEDIRAVRALEEFIQTRLSSAM